MREEDFPRYVAILKEELVPALGCTEPIAIAYAAATARKALGGFPDRIRVRCSGNIVKNVKGVIVPTTGDMKGIETAAILGAVAGNPDLGLESLAEVKPSDIDVTKRFLDKKLCAVELIEGVSTLHIIVEMARGENSSLVEIIDSHTNIARIERDGNLVSPADAPAASASRTDRTFLSLDGIFDFVEKVVLEDVRGLLDNQIDCNMAIAQEGLRGPYGANVGATLLQCYGRDVKILAKALPAAGSDARMNGCALPVVINSGSGNQGLTVSLPIVAYAQSLGCGKERMHRALILSNLVAIYQKNELGKLSAYCGAVSAAVGASAGIAYLHGASRRVIEDAMTNTIANVSGIVCDGAKASCAAKIASAVDAAEMAYYMAAEKRVFPSGEGLVKEDMELTIKSFGRMGREGMKATDLEILRIMLE